MKVVILNNPNDVADYAADIIAQQIRSKADSVLGLATGSSPQLMYERLIKLYHQDQVSFAQVTSFNLDEYYGLAEDHPQSYRYFMQKRLFDHVDIDRQNTYVPPGLAQDPIEGCDEYEARIQRAGGVDLQLLGIGRNGHIGFNEPSSSLGSRTRIKTLTEDTINDNARFFDANEFQPTLALTMGIATIMDAKKVLLIATGESKAKAIKQCIEGAISARVPASILQMHQQVTLVIDEAAAEQLEDRVFYQYIETQNQQLNVSLS